MDRLRRTFSLRRSKRSKCDHNLDPILTLDDNYIGQGGGALDLSSFPAIPNQHSTDIQSPTKNNTQLTQNSNADVLTSAKDPEKPYLWQEDERKVREGSCSFQVKYLGNIEVFESRGLTVCENSVKTLLKQTKSSRFSLSKKKKKKAQQCILYISGDALRVVDEITKGLIVDQTIEKVSFCAPDRYHEKGFAYICRDGTTRRWLCHGFMAVKETGERLSHAVGCAFGVCLEKKQKRERESVDVTYSADKTSFTRIGSFRPTTLEERLRDPQSTIVLEPAPLTPATATTAAKSSASPGRLHTNTCTPLGHNILDPIQEHTNGNATGEEVSGMGGVAEVVSVSDVTAASQDKNEHETRTSIPRPTASARLMGRADSLRLFPKLMGTSPFKRDMSMKLPQTASTLSNSNQSAIANSTASSKRFHQSNSNQGFSVEDFIATPAATLCQSSDITTAESVATVVANSNDKPAATIAFDPFNNAPLNPALKYSLNHTGSISPTHGGLIAGGRSESVTGNRQSPSLNELSLMKKKEAEQLRETANASRSAASTAAAADNSTSNTTNDGASSLIHDPLVSPLFSRLQAPPPPTSPPPAPIAVAYGLPQLNNNPFVSSASSSTGLIDVPSQKTNLMNPFSTSVAVAAPQLFSNSMNSANRGMLF